MKISLNVIEKVNGLILYKGPSLLNKKPIVCIATGLQSGSDNRKTGDFIQTYILSDEGLKPTDAVQQGKDASTCGDCIHRKIDGFGTCYVNLAFGPNGVYKAYLNGKYPEFNMSHLNLFKDKLVRGGAYGDPAAIDYSVWDTIFKVSSGHTAYTHAWKYCDQRIKNYCMASVDTPKQMTLAKSMGWKTFRVRRKDEPLLPGEFLCPASSEAGKRLKCETCLACKGGEYIKQYTPVIMSHGLDWKSNRFNKMQKLMVQKKKFRGLFNPEKQLTI